MLPINSTSSMQTQKQTLLTLFFCLALCSWTVPTTMATISSASSGIAQHPRRLHHAHPHSRSPSSSSQSIGGRTITLKHNEAYHAFKRDRGLDWLIKEKNKLDHKYGSGELAQELGRRADSPVTLANQDKDASYSAEISVGSPGQTFDVALDTGSADLWLLSTECTLDTCSGLDKFDPTSSSTYKNGSTGFSIAYGSGDAQGHLGADTVTLGGFSVQGQTFGVVNTMSAGLVDSPLSGLMGLGFKSLTVTGTTPWWMSLAGTSAWSEPLFGFYMRRYRDVDSAAATEAQGGTLTLGYVDEALYEGDIEYVPVDADKQRYWNIPIKGISMQGKTVSLSGVRAAIDTGTTLIGGPEADVQAIYANIPGSRRMTGVYAGYFEYPCSTDIAMDMTFGSFKVTIRSNDFNIGSYGDDASYCTGGVFVQGLAASSPVQWVVGDTMLKNVYSIYRMTPAAVGFAHLPGSGAVSSSSSASASSSSTSASTSSRASSGTVASSSTASSNSAASTSVSTAIVVVTATGSVDMTSSGVLRSTLLPGDAQTTGLGVAPGESPSGTGTAGSSQPSTTGAALRRSMAPVTGILLSVLLAMFHLV